MKGPIIFYRVKPLDPAFTDRERDFIFDVGAVVMALADGGTIKARSKAYADSLNRYLVAAKVPYERNNNIFTIKQNTHKAVEIALGENCPLK